MSVKPKVTVFIPVHNRSDYVCVAVNSILAQTFGGFELLIVDDGSTDDTVEVLQRYRDPRIRIERNGTNQGIPATRNRGLELARGEYIALLDSDDHAYPERLQKQVAFLDANPAIAQVGSWCSFMDQHGIMLDRIRRQPLQPDDIHAHMLFHCPLVNRTIMARTEILREYGYDTDFPRCQDYDLHSRMVGEQNMANLPDILVCGREHPGRFTGQTGDLGKNRKMAIYWYLLNRVNIDATEQDLERHHALTRRSDRRDETLDYLEWAEAWLCRLKQANLKHMAMPKPAFHRVLGALWALNCWQAHKELGKRKMLGRLLRSPLVRGIPGNLRPRFLMLAMRKAPKTDISDHKP
ncbi:MAG: glycosyltransferase family A protein [Pseudomonadota bacterium]